MPTGFVEYIESHLGMMSGGSHFADSVEESVNIARFENQPVQDALTYVTLGVSKHILHQVENPSLRVELIGCVWSHFRESGLDSLLFVLAEDILKSHHVPPMGSVVGPRGPIVPGSSLEAFIFLQPGYHDPALHVFKHPSEPVHLLWPVPITSTEASFVGSNGWSEFQDLLIEFDPDLLDLRRPSIL